jgi:hypothetical protein
MGAFISGDYADAAARFENLADKAKTEEQLRDVYWYLGRVYLAAGQYNGAIDAFTTGRAHGGGVEFDEYLRQLDALVSGDPDNVVRSERITRVQLAVLIDRMFFTDRDAGGEQSPPAHTGELSGQLESVERGVMDSLPDGRFHPEAFVTRGAFYVAVSKLIRVENIDVDTGVLFQNGFAWVLDGGEDDGKFITGKEAVGVLERVAAGQNSYGGQGS